MTSGEHVFVEQSEQDIAKPRGQVWLELIGYGHRIDEEIVQKDGTTKPAKYFDQDEACEQYAAPVFVAIEHLSLHDPTNPELPEYIESARMVADMHLGPDTNVGTEAGA